ncbi:hypothetical protein HPB50_027807 [Hyalomma asiaticum]|nr:hypothetical protein HPB50_027807 [Hyalomma asiaticum]
MPRQCVQARQTRRVLWPHVPLRPAASSKATGRLPRGPPVPLSRDGSVEGYRAAILATPKRCLAQIALGHRQYGTLADIQGPDWHGALENYLRRLSLGHRVGFASSLALVGNEVPGAKRACRCDYAGPEVTKFQAPRFAVTAARRLRLGRRLELDAVRDVSHANIASWGHPPLDRTSNVRCPSTLASLPCCPLGRSDRDARLGHLDLPRLRKQLEGDEDNCGSNA